MPNQSIPRNYRSERPSVGIKFDDKSLAVQASRDECDINTIVKKYLRTGELPGLREGVYADISEMPDLAAAIQMVSDADQAFMALPAEIRRRFDNDPVNLVAFAQDHNNLAEAISLGLAVAKPSGQLPPKSPAGQAGTPGTEPGTVPAMSGPN